MVPIIALDIISYPSHHRLSLSLSHTHTHTFIHCFLSCKQVIEERQQQAVQMLLRKTIHKTKNFFKKTIQNFKSFIFGGYKKLTRAPSLNLFNINNPKMQQLDNFYKEFCNQMDSNDNNNINQNTKASEKQDIASNEILIDSQDHSSLIISSFEEDKDVGCSKYVNGGSQSNVLEQKMRELEMMDMKDEEHVLDIEEVLHYYSLLKSPIYQDLVDKFFTDMYAEFNVPQPPIRSNSLNSSIRRLGPLNI